MICKNSLPVYGLSFHFLSDVLWNTNVLILTLFSLFIFFFCCLCIPELSPSTLSLSPYSSSSGFWLGWEAVVLWTGSSSLRVCSFFPWTLSYPCVPLAHLPCTLRLIATSWQQPTRQLPLLQLLPLSVCSTCCCQTHQPSVSPLIQMTSPLPAQVQLVLQGRIRSSSFSSSASTWSSLTSSHVRSNQPRLLVAFSDGWLFVECPDIFYFVCYLRSVSPWAHSLLSWAHVPICKNGDNHHLMKIWWSMPAQCCLTWALYNSSHWKWVVSTKGDHVRYLVDLRGSPSLLHRPPVIFWSELGAQWPSPCLLPPACGGWSFSQQSPRVC